MGKKTLIFGAAVLVGGMSLFLQTGEQEKKSMVTETSAKKEEHLISHTAAGKAYDYAGHRAGIENADPAKLLISKEEALSMFDQLMGFELGRWLLANKGIDGYWTAYVILHGPQKSGLSEMENFILHKAPVVRATQERFSIFKKKLQEHMEARGTQKQVHMCSLPCGTMEDLLGLDTAKVSAEVLFTGSDLDETSLQLAAQNAEAAGAKATFEKEDAWELKAENSYDILTSNGLNIYEPDDQKVTALYKQFHKALKPGGVLITSFLTPPPALSSDSPWKNIDPAAATKQKALFGAVIQVGWQSFRTEAVTRKQLEEAGFEVIDVIYDHQHMFPTVVARKK
ncbi:class I SAM-dependent methyltransferase [Alphaproteobacteria bacterium]|nr:class I SAM-dependent methyltransferase [Alphaproteobacteria bacterium]